MAATRGEARRSWPRTGWQRVSGFALAVSTTVLVIIPAAALGVAGDFTSAPTSPEPAGNGPTSIVAANLNGDANTDLAVANQYSDDVTILLGDGTGDFTPAPTSPEPAGNGPSSIVATYPPDFNGDSNADLAVANRYSDDVTILLGDGTGDFTPAPTSPEQAGDGPTSITTGIFNESAAGPLDLAVANGGSDDVSILLSDGSGDFNPAPTSPEPVGSGPSSIDVDYFGGFARDYEADLVVANAGSDDLSILLGDGNGDFASSPTSPEAVGAGPTAVNSTCFDSIGMCTSGVRDLVVAHGGDNSVSILSNSGLSDFAAGAPIPVGGAPSSLISSSSRYNPYGFGIAVANGGSDDVSIVSEDGTPAATSPETVGSDPTSIVTGELNGDGKVDLAVANGGSDNVSILLNDFAPAQARPRDPVTLKKCIKKAKRRHKYHQRTKKRAIRKCKRKFG